MFKMQIKINEEKVLKEDVVNLKKMYLAIDNIFFKNGLTKGETEPDGTLNYLGYNDCKDFGRFATCTLYLTKINDWFMPNCSKWLLLEQASSGEWFIDDMLSTMME